MRSTTLFGPEQEADSLRTDAVLLGIGAALLLWFGLFNGPRIVGVLGVLAMGLGLALPIQRVSRRAAEARTRASLERQLGDGLALNVEDSAAASLVAVYETLVGSDRHITDRDEMIDAAHTALHETAVLLGGRRPLEGPRIGICEAATRSAQRHLSGSAERANSSRSRSRHARPCA